MIRKLSMIAATAALALGAVWALTVPQSSNGADLLISPANAQAAAELDIASIPEMRQGNPDAAVTLIEYASFTCPHCARFHLGPYQQLKADYIDTGKINYIYREVYFDPFGVWASALARCGDGPERFFGMVDALYSSTDTWIVRSASGAPDPAGIADQLRKLGRIAGIPNDQLEACMTDETRMRTLVAWYQANAEADGIQSTPSFVLNGKRHENMSYEDLSALIEKALGN
jgi:protein-disulfide isomerase